MYASTPSESRGYRRRGHRTKQRGVSPAPGDYIHHGQGHSPNDEPNNTSFIATTPDRPRPPLNPTTIIIPSPQISPLRTPSSYDRDSFGYNPSERRADGLLSPTAYHSPTCGCQFCGPFASPRHEPPSSSSGNYFGQQVPVQTGPTSLFPTPDLSSIHPLQPAHYAWQPSPSIPTPSSIHSLYSVAPMVPPSASHGNQIPDDNEDSDDDDDDDSGDGDGSGDEYSDDTGNNRSDNQDQYTRSFPSPSVPTFGSIHPSRPVPPPLLLIANPGDDEDPELGERSNTDEGYADSNDSGDEVVTRAIGENRHQVQYAWQPSNPPTLGPNSTHPIYPASRQVVRSDYYTNNDSEDDENSDSNASEYDDGVVVEAMKGGWRQTQHARRLSSPQNPSPSSILSAHSSLPTPTLLLPSDSNVDGAAFETRNRYRSVSMTYGRGRSDRSGKQPSSASGSQEASRRFPSHSHSPNSNLGEARASLEEHASFLTRSQQAPNPGANPSLAPPSPTSSGLMPPRRPKIDLSVLFSPSPYATAPSSPHPLSSPPRSLPAVYATPSEGHSPAVSAARNTDGTNKPDSGRARQPARQSPLAEQLPAGSNDSTKESRESVSPCQPSSPSGDTPVPASTLLLEVLQSPPPAPSKLASSIPGVPSALPFLGLETGLEFPRVSKLDTKTISVHTRSIEEDLQDLRGQELSKEGAPVRAHAILEEVQELDKRVSMVEDHIKRNSSLLPQSIKQTKEILNDLKGLLRRVDQPDTRQVLPYSLAIDRSLSMLAMLARSLFSLPESENSGEVFNLSKTCLSIATASLPEGHLAKPIIASHWGTLYLQRFQFFGQQEHVSQAIKFHRQSIQAIPEDHPKRAMFLGWLGRSYLARFEANLNADDLRQGIEYNSIAWTDIESRAEKATNEERKHILEGKGRALQCLVEHVGGLNSLSLINCGIGEWRTTLLELLSHPHTDDGTKASCMRTLGFLYITRFDQLGGQRHRDLERSLVFLTAAVASLPKLHSDLRSTLCVLAHSLIARSNSCTPQNRADSDLALKFLDLAKQLTPKNHSFEPHLLASCGDAHLSLSRGGEDKTHLAEAIDYYTEVSDHHLRRPGSRLWAKVQQKLGICFLYKYNTMRKGHPDDRVVRYLKQALGQFIFVALSPRGHLFDRFTAASSWATNAASHPAFRKQALYGYETAMDLIPLLACFGAVPDQRHKATQKAGQLATEAAALAIEEQDYVLALTLLEQGRSVKWSHLLQLQTPLHYLKLHPQGQLLAEELETLLRRLQLEENISSDNSPTQSPLEDLCLQDSYQKVLDQIRQLRGFANFMRPKPFEDLLKAARNGPVVVINVHETRCDALIVHPVESNAGIQHVPLPGLAIDGVVKMRETIDQALADIGGTRTVGSTLCGEEGQEDQAGDSTTRLETQLKNLWDWVVNPVLEGLGYKPRSATGSDPSELPHITWCPTGPLSFLPLHAAGDYQDPGQKKTFEYVVSSYTPTLSAILPDPFHEVQPKPYCDILLVNPENNASDEPSLPGAEEELERISEHFKAATSSWAVRIADKVQRFVGIKSWFGTQDLISPQGDHPDPKCSLDMEGVSDDELSDSDQEMPNTKRFRNSKLSENVGNEGKVPLCTRLEGLEANPDRVYEEMQRHDWVHLACHAVQNDGDSTRCGFYLGDKLLSLQKIAQMRYEKRGLAFLSACQTATGDHNLPDEAVHLASGMLMTGYSSVIATMWPVRDVDAPEVADIVYERLLVEDRMSCKRSAVALHLALDNLRNSVEIAYWIPFVHFGA